MEYSYSYSYSYIAICNLGHLAVVVRSVRHSLKLVLLNPQPQACKLSQYTICVYGSDYCTFIVCLVGSRLASDVLNFSLCHVCTDRWCGLAPARRPYLEPTSAMNCDVLFYTVQRSSRYCTMCAQLNEKAHDSKPLTFENSCLAFRTRSRR